MKQIKIASIVDKLTKVDDKVILYGRSSGRNIKELLIKELSTLDEKDFVVADFSDIYTCDVTFINEAVFQTIVYAKKYLLNRFLILSNLSESLTEAIRATQLLREYRDKCYYPISHYSNGSIWLLGDMEKELTDIFNMMFKRKKPITTIELCEIINVKPNNASNKLKKLHEYSLLFRTEVIEETGRHFVYEIANMERVKDIK